MVIHLFIEVERGQLHQQRQAEVGVIRLGDKYSTAAPSRVRLEAGELVLFHLLQPSTKLFSLILAVIKVALMLVAVAMDGTEDVLALASETEQSHSLLAFPTVRLVLLKWLHYCRRIGLLLLWLGNFLLHFVRVLDEAQLFETRGAVASIVR